MLTQAKLGRERTQSNFPVVVWDYPMRCIAWRRMLQSSLEKRVVLSKRDPVFSSAVLCSLVLSAPLLSSPSPSVVRLTSCTTTARAVLDSSSTPYPTSKYLHRYGVAVKRGYKGPFGPYNPKRG
eukprot:746552-Hanusia_phi.AAC.4